jgi:16S rRNA (cytosine1407-C5)-methyltransferase
MAAKGAGPVLPVQVPGLTEWQGKTLDSRLADTLRIVPDDLWDGFFLARIRKPI